ncbi:MAG: flagellar filament capping protein FliD [Armatimonadota bacterium]|nr:flagellar filament capping protein FliD [bacterium]
MSGSMSISGLVSGLDTDSIIEKIMEYYTANQEMLEADQTECETELAVWQSINTSVLAVQTAADSIKDAEDFQTNTCTSSDEDILTATADTDATPGTYFITVNQLAQAHQVASNTTYTSKNDEVGTGTVSFTFANDSSMNFSVTIDSNNNTLAGLARAINNADSGIDASIVNTGTTDTPTYQLVLTSSETGSSTQFTVASTLSGGSEPALSNITQTGQDAKLTYGSGDNAISVTKESNTIDDLIDGVTINLEDTNTEKTIKVTVARDTSTITSSIENFVEAYNNLMEAVDEEFKYDESTEKTGTLFGNYKLQSLQEQIRSAVSSIVSGLDSDYASLASIGVTHDTDGYLKIDDDTLSKALSGNLDDVRKLFSTNAESDSAYVSYVISTSATEAGSYQVVITQAATRSTLTCGAAFGDPANSNKLGADETIYVEGQEIKLTADMTIDQAVNTINKYSDDTGVSVSATGSDGTGTGNYLTFQSVKYGSSSNFSVYSETSCTTTGSTGIGTTVISASAAQGESGNGTGTVGVDVAGTINGAKCKGSARVLTCKDESNNACGLSLLCTSSTTMKSMVKYTEGVGDKLNDLIEDMTSDTGLLTTAQDSLQDQIDDYDTQIAKEKAKATAKQDELYEKFNAMEEALSELDSQSSYLDALLGNDSSDN